MRVRLTIAIVALGVFLTTTAVTVVAHHAFAAEFDANRPVEFTGTVTKMEWVNPHVWMHIDVDKPDGTKEAWLHATWSARLLLAVEAIGKQLMLV